MPVELSLKFMPPIGSDGMDTKLEFFLNQVDTFFLNLKSVRQRTVAMRWDEIWQSVSSSWARIDLPCRMTFSSHNMRSEIHQILYRREQRSRQLWRAPDQRVFFVD